MTLDEIAGIFGVIGFALVVIGLPLHAIGMRILRKKGKKNDKN